MEHVGRQKGNISKARIASKDDCLFIATVKAQRSFLLDQAKTDWNRRVREETFRAHGIGHALRQAIDFEQERGHDVVQIWAKGLGTTVDALNRCVAVASSWTCSEIQAITEKTDVYGRPITFDHLVLIAREQQPGPRRVLLGDVLRLGLTVEQLATRLRRRSPRKGQISHRSIMSGLRKVQQRARRYLDTEGGSNEEIVELVAEQLIQGEVPRGTMAGLIKKLAESKADQKEVLKSAKWTVKRLGQLIRELPSSDRSLESRDRPVFYSKVSELSL